MSKNEYTTSDNGVRFITRFEGEILHVYDDGFGYPTAGVGHLLTAAEKKQYPIGTKITKEQSRAWLKQDLRKAEEAVRNGVNVPITQNQFDALVSFTFNVGIGGFNRSSVRSNLNNRHFTAAADSLLKWNKAGGKTVKGLTRRREAERELFLTPDKPTSTSSAGPSADRTSEDRAGDTRTSSDESASQAAPPATQIADAIVNTGDQKVPPGFTPEQKTVNAPEKENSTKAATGMTIAGFAVPAVIVAIIRSIQDLVANGYLNAKDIGDTVLAFLGANTKYVLMLVGLVIVMMIAKKAFKQITLWVKMWINSDPNRHDIEVKPQ